MNKIYHDRYERWLESIFIKIPTTDGTKESYEYWREKWEKILFTIFNEHIR